MRQRLWIATMALIALAAAGGSRALAQPADDLGFCLTSGSTCSSASECCSNKCNCSNFDDPGCNCID